MASYSNSDNSYQTLRAYKHVWCYQREPVLRRIKKTRFVWRYPCKTLYNNTCSVAFHSIVILKMLCVSCLLTAWLQESCFDCALMLMWASSSCSCVHPGHHGIYRFIWLSFNANNSPFWGKEFNQSDTFSKQLSTGLAFTNTDWDSVMWGCSLTIIVRILSLLNMSVVTEWQYKVSLWNFERKLLFPWLKFNWEKLPNSFRE